jgi:hypothetical protein
MGVWWATLLRAQVLQAAKPHRTITSSSSRGMHRTIKPLQQQQVPCQQQQQQQQQQEEPMGSMPCTHRLC